MKAVAAAVCAVLTLGLVVAAWRASAAPVAVKASPPRLSKKSLLGGGNGGFDDHGDLWGRVSNLTPYTWTLVTAQNCGGCSGLGDGVDPPATVKPGQDYVYAARCDECAAIYWHFDTTITYRAQTVTGPEDLTIRITGYHYSGYHGSEVLFQVFNSRPPAAREIGWTEDDAVGSDVQFQIQGHFAIDAAKDPPALVDVINGLCAGATGTTCAFTQTGPVTWGIGDPIKKAEAYNCTRSSSQPAAVSADPPEPPGLDPNYHVFKVTQARTASVSVGGSLTASAEVNLLGVIDTEVSATIGADHEWSDTQELEKSTKVYIPSNWVGAVWVAPVQGKVIGTLVVSNAVASYTITNFEQVKSGVSRDLLTPAFNVLTTSRPMTAAEYQAQCVSKLAATAPRPAPTSGLG